MIEKIHASGGLKLMTARSVGQPLTHRASGAPSNHRSEYLGEPFKPASHSCFALTLDVKFIYLTAEAVFLSLLSCSPVITLNVGTS